MSRHRKAGPVAVARHRLAPGMLAGAIPREYRHQGGGHRAELGCFSGLVLAVVLIATLIVDTHRSRA